MMNTRKCSTEKTKLCGNLAYFGQLLHSLGYIIIQYNSMLLNGLAILNIPIYHKMYFCEPILLANDFENMFHKAISPLSVSFKKVIYFVWLESIPQAL